MEALVAMGPFPGEEEAEIEDVERREAAVLAITEPASREEAEALLTTFGPDSCFGLAWAVLHLIESAPDGPIVEHEPPDDGSWRRRLWERYEMGRAQGVVE